MKRLRCRVGWISLMFAVALASCNAAGNNVPSTPGGGGATTFSPLGFSPAITPLPGIGTSPGKIDGTDDRFSPADGDTSTGGQGKTVDGKVPCLPSMGNGYHVHVFLGIVYKGQLMAIPDGIGMVNPGPEDSGYINTAQCFYEIHTHDASGIVHLEVADYHPASAVVFKLKQVLDVWGVPHSPNSFGPFKGKIHVFTGMPSALGQVHVDQYAPFTGKHWTLMGLHSHEVIWVEIGKPYYRADQLPLVTFYTEY